MKERRTSDASLFNPIEDPHFSDTIQDFLTIFNPQELEEKPYLQNYLVELLARWGRWLSRGRAPALCFEAACVGGLSFLKRTGREPCGLTDRADAALARLLAGMVIDEVEPMARKQGGPAREKAIVIVADEFLAKTASSNPSVANSAKKRMKKRISIPKMAGTENLLIQERNLDPRRPSFETNYPHRPNIGVDRKASLGDDNSYPNAGYPMQQKPDNEYYFRAGGSSFSSEPISYSTGSSYGRGRKISNDSSHFEPHERNVINQLQRHPIGNQRTRQASVPLYTSSEPYFDQSRLRKNSVEGWDSHHNQHFSDSKFVPGQKTRDSSLERGPTGLPSDIGSSNDYPDRSTTGRLRKTSADSNLGRNNYTQNVAQVYQNQPANGYYENSIPAYNPDYVIRPRKKSLTDQTDVSQSRNRTGSVDRGLNASRYDGDNRIGNMSSRQQGAPSLPNPNRRPSQQTKPGFYPQQQSQRSRYPSNNNEDPFDRQYSNQQRSSPPKHNNSVKRGGISAQFSTRQPEQVESDYGYRSYRDPGRRPSQESDDSYKRRPSHEEAPMHNRSGPSLSYRQPDDRNRAPNSDYSRNPKPGQTTPDHYNYNPGSGINRSKTPNSSRDPKQIEDLGNYLQNAQPFDSPKKE